MSATRVERRPWFSRQFGFDAPAWAYPNLVERVRGTPARVEERVRALSAGVLTRARDGRWSIQENVGHLLDLEALWAERLDDFESAAAVLRATDLQNRKTFEAKHNERATEDILRAFRAARASFVARLDAYDESFIERIARHPRLQQPMRVIDLVLFVAEHDDHHLATITELLKDSP